MKKDYWGDIADESPENSPKAILQEQAYLLTDKTRGELEATVASQGSGEKIRTTLAVAAPALNYRFDLVTVYYTLDFYPLVFSDDLTKKRHRCESEHDFRDRLKTVLSSQRTRKRLHRLLDVISKRRQSRLSTQSR